MVETASVTIGGRRDRKFADRGFNCIKLADDWQGADFLAYHMNDTTTLKVQLKSRLTINQKYCGKGIWMAFPHEEYWYLIEHDRLVDKVGKHTKWLNVIRGEIRRGTTPQAST